MSRAFLECFRGLLLLLIVVSCFSSYLECLNVNFVVFFSSSFYIFEWTRTCDWSKVEGLPPSDTERKASTSKMAEKLRSDYSRLLIPSCFLLLYLLFSFLCCCCVSRGLSMLHWRFKNSAHKKRSKAIKKAKKGFFLQVSFQFQILLRLLEIAHSLLLFIANRWDYDFHLCQTQTHCHSARLNQFDIFIIIATFNLSPEFRQSRLLKLFANICISHLNQFLWCLTKFCWYENWINDVRA